VWTWKIFGEVELATLRWEVEGVKELTELTSELVGLRNDVSKRLRTANDVQIGLLEAICRNKIKTIENDFTNFQDQFIVYEERLNNFLTKWFGPQVRFPDLGSQISLTLYYSSLSNYRDSVRSLLRDLGRVIEDRRSRANNLIGITVSLITLLVAIIAILT